MQGTVYSITRGCIQVVYINMQMMHNGGEAPGVWIEVDIYAGSRWLLRVAACCESLDSGSNMVTVHLQQGDVVWMQVVRGSALWGGGHSSFSGVRLAIR